MSIYWRPAAGADISTLVKLSELHFSADSEGIWQPDTLRLSHTLTISTVDQWFNPASALVSVALVDDSIGGYVWAEKSQPWWSSDWQASVRIMHWDLRLSARVRVALTDQALSLVEGWAGAHGISVVCSSSVRKEQSAFMRIHQRRGYQVRGSIAYKKIIATN